MEDKRQPNPWHWWTVAVMMLLVAYVLSAGPAMMLQDRVLQRTRFGGWYGIVYAPLRWLSDSSPEPISQSYNWYVELWYEKPYVFWCQPASK